jgi:threonine/homoserine/homoserine lactone efflux protein
MNWAFGAIALVIFVSAITPGPNNLIVLSMAAERGARGAAPAMLAVIAGGVAMIVLARAGLSMFFLGHHWVLRIITVVGAGYLAWLGVSLIANAQEARPAVALSARSTANVMALFMFQFANPKAWILVLTAVSAASAGHITTSTLVVLFASISLTSLSLWALLGQAMRRWERHPRVRVAFDCVMGASLIASTLVLAVDY